jgi:mono/diheme cytochrome c family protein
MTKPSWITMWAAFVAVILLVPATQAWAQEAAREMRGRAGGRCPCTQMAAGDDADGRCPMMGRGGGARRIDAAPVPRPERGTVGDGAPVEPDARALAEASPARGAAVFRSRCTACHGAEGRGDGPAAAALRPRPPDLTRSERVRTTSAAELLAFLRVGRWPMPAFGSTLTNRELGDLVAWLRAGNEPGRPGGGSAQGGR